MSAGAGARVAPAAAEAAQELAAAKDADGADDTVALDLSGPSDKGAEGSGGESDEENDVEYRAWKSNIPALYDVFLNHNIVWSALSCCWGGAVPSDVPRCSARALYLGTRTRTCHAQRDRPCRPASCAPRFSSGSVRRGAVQVARRAQHDPSVPHHPARATHDGPARHGAVPRGAQERVRGAREGHRAPGRGEPRQVRRRCACAAAAPHGREAGRANPQHPHIVASHTDSQVVYVWNTNTQANRLGKQHLTPNLPDLLYVRPCGALAAHAPSSPPPHPQPAWPLGACAVRTGIQRARVVGRQRRCVCCHTRAGCRGAVAHWPRVARRAWRRCRVRQARAGVAA